jgi:hypothetical protein
MEVLFCAISFDTQDHVFASKMIYIEPPLENEHRTYLAYLSR